MGADGWAELGRTIARKMAARPGAEWRPHCWDNVTEGEGWHRKPDPDWEAAYPQLRALWISANAEDNDLQDTLRSACLDAWRSELETLLREKRGSRPMVRSGETWMLGDKPVRSGDWVHLLLACGKTVAVTLDELRTSPETIFVRIELSQHSSSLLALPPSAEFLGKSADSSYPNATTGRRTARLWIEDQGCGMRHKLGSRDVNCGSGLTLALPYGPNIGGRYEANLSVGADNTPCFHFSLAGGIEGVTRVLALPDDAEFVLEASR